MTSPPELHLARRCRCWKGGREAETKGGREGGYYKGRTGVIEGRGREREKGREGRKEVWRVRRREGVREGITKAGREGWVRREGGREWLEGGRGGR